MKVIRPGKDVVGWSRELSCTGKGNEGSGCGAVLQVEEGDLWYVEAYSWGERDLYYTFVCPLCGCMTDVSNVPGMVQSSVQDRCRGMVSSSYVKNESKRVKAKRLREVNY